MIRVLSKDSRVDKHGKKYYYFNLHSPREKVVSEYQGKNFQFYTSDKTVGFIAYPVNYAQSQGSDVGADLEVGDELEGRIVTKRVQNYASTDLSITDKCTVPVFCSDNDPIQFEVEMEKAFLRAGRCLLPFELKYGKSEFAKEKEQERFNSSLPPGCLIVGKVKSNNLIKIKV